MTTLIDQLKDTGQERFYGRYRVSRSWIRSPSQGAPVTVEANGDGAQITVGDSAAKDFVASRCMILTGSFDATTGKLKGTYDDGNPFEISLDASAGRTSRRLCCAVRGVVQGFPKSETWEADEDGPP